MLVVLHVPLAFAMIAVGIFAVVLGGRALWLVPASFVAMMVVGFGLGVSGVALPYVELGIALSSIVIGFAAALGRPMPVAAAMALAGVFAIFHGHAHGAEMPAGAPGLEYALGFILATAALHLAGIGAAIGVTRVNVSMMIDVTAHAASAPADTASTPYSDSNSRISRRVA